MKTAKDFTKEAVERGIISKANENELELLMLNYMENLLKNWNSRINFRQIVSDLNSELYEKFGHTEMQFEYLTTGYADVIMFNNVGIWTSEMDDRVWDEEKKDYEPFEPFIRRIFNEHISKQYSLKM